MAYRSTFVLVALSVSVACASARQPSFTRHFVRQGTPAMDLGGPSLAHSGGEVEKPKAGRRPGISSGVSRVVTGNPVETSNPLLRNALRDLLLAPTVENHLQVAREYQRLGVWDHSHRYLEKSLQVNGPDARVYDALARLWRDWGLPATGLAHAHRAVYLAPQSAAAHNTLGTLLYQLGHRAEAEAEFKKAHELEPAKSYALANLCYVTFTQGRTREAIPLCRQASALRKRERGGARQD